MRSFPTFVALLCLLSPLVGAAQNPARTADSVDTRVAEVESGGYWEAGGTRGTYRVIVLSEGWEEVRYSAVVQWLQEMPNQHELVIRSAFSLADLASSYWSLHTPRIWSRDRIWYVTLKAATAPMQQAKDSLTFRLGPPGQVTKSH